MKVVTFGVFDLFHIGHLNLFLKIKSYFKKCDLIVAIQDTKSIKKYKPNTEIWYSLKDRKKIINQLKCVDGVIIYNDVYETVKNLDFDVLVKGPDQNNTSFVKAVEFCRKNNKQVLVIPRTEGVSSSRIKEAIK